MLVSGDLIDLTGSEGTPQRYLICQLDPDVGQAFAIDTSGRRYQIPIKADEEVGCVRVANPFTDWPFLQMPKGCRGPLAVSLPKLDGSAVPLRFLFDWLVGEPLRAGGALYLNPALRLRTRDRLALTYKERVVGVQVPAQFGTLSQRVQRPRATAPARTFYDRLLDDD